MNAERRTGRVVASYGRQVMVESAQRYVHCKVLGRRLQVVCGDEVFWEPGTSDDEGTVLERLPRKTTLSRTDAVGRTEIVVANVTQLLVVLSPKPVPDFFVIDRYVAAAELAGIRAALVLNKIDLGLGHESEKITGELSNYRQLGYPVLECSAATGTGIDALQAQLADQTNVLVGQSGTGKSSLANRLMPDLNATTSELSRATAEGKHTTSVSTLHHLPSGGGLIDSPGVRDFAPAIELLLDVASGFREMIPLAAQCRFNDCRHLREPGCAIRQAVTSGALAPRRYESYRRLLRLSEDLAPEPGSTRS